MSRDREKAILPKTRAQEIGPCCTPLEKLFCASCARDCVEPPKVDVTAVKFDAYDSEPDEK